MRFAFTTKQPRFGVPSSMAAFGLLAMFGVALSVPGCGGVGSIGGGALGGECLLDSDCSEKLICAYQFCHIPCNESKDCTFEGEECLIGHENNKDPYNYCDRPTACVGDAECGDSRVCSDNKCRDVCTVDNDCLAERRCFHGGCRMTNDPTVTDWNAPADLGAPCTIPSDCISKNCNAVCIGCVEDYDCGGMRTCDPTAINNTGKCSGGTGVFSATVTPLDIGNLMVRSAIPDSKGQFVYFTAIDPASSIGGLYMADRNGNVCTVWAGDPIFGVGDIAISGDDATLFVTGQWPSDPSKKGGISTLKAGSCDVQSDPQLIPWTNNIYAQSVQVFGEGDGDAIYFYGQPVAPTVIGFFKGSMDGGAFWVEHFGYSYLAIGASRKLMLGQFGEVGEIQPDKSIRLLISGAYRVGYPDSVIHSIAFDTNESTIYIPYSGYGEDLVIAINAANPSETKQFSKFRGFEYQSASSYWGRINRARTTNIFSWVTDDGKLFLFEPH